MNTKLYILLRERRAVSVRVYLRFYNAGIRQSHLKNTKIFLSENDCFSLKCN